MLRYLIAKNEWKQQSRTEKYQIKFYRFASAVASIYILEQILLIMNIILTFGKQKNH